MPPSAVLAISKRHLSVCFAGQMRITDIERHEILLPFHDFNATTLFRYHGLGIQLRTIYVVKTNNGLSGLRRELVPGAGGKGTCQVRRDKPL